jgi:acetyl esterase
MPPQRTVVQLQKRLRLGASHVVSDGMLNVVAKAARRAPAANPERHNVEVIRDIPYMDTDRRAHHLDIYRPTKHPGPRPIVLYIHGGGFRMLSKDSHWIMGLAYARQGYLVFNISYRLAPRHPFPAAIEDSCDALAWVGQNAEKYGGDLSRISFAGESAGANLVTALSVATCYRRPEPYARRAWDTGIVANAVIPACGMLQVSDAERFSRRRSVPIWINSVLLEVSRSYLHGYRQPEPGVLDLADPLLVFERGEQPDRPLPPFFIPCGTKDPLLDDTRRLHAALQALGVESEAAYYEGEIHAFHAMVWRRAARRCWRDTYGFLDRFARTPKERHETDAEPASAAGAAV